MNIITSPDTKVGKLSVENRFYSTAAFTQNFIELSNLNNSHLKLEQDVVYLSASIPNDLPNTLDKLADVDNQISNNVQQLSKQLNNYIGNGENNCFQAFNTKEQSYIFKYSSDVSAIPISGLRTIEKDGQLYRQVVLSANRASTLQPITTIEDRSVDDYYLSSSFFRIPSAIKTKSGRTIAIYDVRWKGAYDIGSAPYNDQVIAMSYSDDNAKTWTTPKCIIDWVLSSQETINGTLLTCWQSGASDPGILYDEENNIVFVFAIAGRGFIGPASESTNTVSYSSAIRQQMVMTYSTDEGNTWSTPESISHRIYDDENAQALNIPPEWGKTYYYLFPSCSAGFITKHQPNKNNNGKMFIPVQLHTRDVGGNSRATLMQVTASIVDGQVNTSFNLINTNDALIGSINGGSDEGQCCEGPNGEFVFFVKSYSTNSYDRYQNGTGNNYSINPKYMYMGRIYKSNDMGQSWHIIGDMNLSQLNTSANVNDIVPTSLMSIGKCKPGLMYSNALNSYIVSYQLELCYNNGSSSRENVVLMYSKDLLSWKPFEHVENPGGGAGYSTFLQLPSDNDDVEIIFESYDEIRQANSAQFKVVKFGFYGSTPEYSNSTLQPLIMNSQQRIIQGFTFKTFDFSKNGYMNVKNLKIRGGTTNTSTPAGPAYAAIYEDGYLKAVSDIITLYKFCVYVFTWQTKNPNTNEYQDSPIMLKPNITYTIIIYKESSTPRNNIINSAITNLKSNVKDFTSFPERGNETPIMEYFSNINGNVQLYSSGAVLENKTALISFDVV